MTAPVLHLTDERAQQLLEGSLPAQEAARAGDHAATCPGCAALVESYRVLAGALDDLPGPALPADFTDRVLDAVALRERDDARERLTAAAVLGGVLAALVLAVTIGGAAWLVPATARLAEQAGAVSRALRLGVEVLPPLFGALRLPLAAACALLALPMLYSLSRSIHPPRTEPT